MPGPRQPLVVIEGKGKKHLTKKEKLERAEREVKAEKPKYVLAPDYLPQELREKFKSISRQLLALDIFSKLDRDSLAMYLIARSQYVQATEHVQRALEAGKTEAVSDWAGVQDKFFKQARACANDLGLTVTSRCRLVLPQKKDEDEGDEMEKLFSRRYG